MSRIIRVTLWVVLGAFVSGCSTYRSATIPGTGSWAEDDRSSVSAVPGLEARILLSSGESVEGEIRSVNDISIIVGRVGNFGYEEQVISLDEVELVEVKKSSSAEGLIVLSVVVAGLVVLGVAVANAYGDVAVQGN